MLNFFLRKKADQFLKTVEETIIPNNKQAVRKGELGEYKIDLQLSQFPKNYRYLSDLLIKNPKSFTGYSQIDNVLISPFGIFVIESKNYQGTVYGGKTRKTWSVNGKFNVGNPLAQNYGHIRALAACLDEKYENLFISIIAFTKRSRVKVEPELRKITSNELVIYDIELTEFIKRKEASNKSESKLPLLYDNEIEEAFRSFTEANIVDLEIKGKHVSEIAKKKSNSVTRFGSRQF
ncbi:nuclease-related domain-containing protein [Fictibacillus aquaticus]|uniref:NERD domain-containing protein n=1 Tax=Fictibacillus aquaticus TaxID=2021314 RepID=A0A235F8P0_9BACL|nr:nuclease-related domain-containing protein [Fictibacillus aquaticus]OYD57676.1 hypothetical protein CGZ90_13510 [Fictibacillus aquaticus]